MAEYVTYEELQDYPINAGQAAAVYGVLQENAQAPWTKWRWVFVQRLERFNRLLAEGMDMREIARMEVMEIYREQEKRSEGSTESSALVEAQLDIFAALGIEPQRVEGGDTYAYTIRDEDMDPDDDDSAVLPVRQDVEYRERYLRRQQERVEAGLPWTDEPV